MSQYHSGKVIVGGQEVSASTYMEHQRNERILNKLVGYIYVIHCTTTDYYKIGQSKSSVNSRLTSMQVGCPFELEVITCREVRNYLALERQLHADFADCSVRGEWFKLSVEDLQVIDDVLTSNGTDLSHLDQMQYFFKESCKILQQWRDIEAFADHDIMYRCLSDALDCVDTAKEHGEVAVRNWLRKNR